MEELSFKKIPNVQVLGRKIPKTLSACWFKLTQANYSLCAAKTPQKKAENGYGGHPGHPYASQSIHVTTNPIYKSKDGKYDQHNDERLLNPTSRPKTSTQITSPRMAGSPLEVFPRSPRAKTAPPGYKDMPPLNKAQKASFDDIYCVFMKINSATPNFHVISH
ncbi:unnamed protein product [Clavelina lepadiformis]|uniref:Uncharacterized protein n=1 Tax=Clavelina lepadiformis TaxID=159417 RepID=A0ABP0FPI4_CLALP